MKPKTSRPSSQNQLSWCKTSKRKIKKQSVPRIVLLLRNQTEFVGCRVLYCKPTTAVDLLFPLGLLASGSFQPGLQI